MPVRHCEFKSELRWVPLIVTGDGGAPKRSSRRWIYRDIDDTRNCEFALDRLEITRDGPPTAVPSHKSKGLRPTAEGERCYPLNHIWRVEYSLPLRRQEVAGGAELKHGHATTDRDLLDLLQVISSEVGAISI
ncbi:unnamed protein product [Lasius platythorax]|uniref:Uncharacterized protein n=1 Tax=Lasius platythorax TaxID=488582 RepID=A0AAV2MYH2_9HYME